MPETTPAPADRVAAELAAIRALVARRDELVASMRVAPGAVVPVSVTVFNAAQDRLAERAPALLAAVEAAMRFHAPAESADGTRFCTFCSCATGEIIKAPCPETEAITTELLGEEERP